MATFGGVIPDREAIDVIRIRNGGGATQSSRRPAVEADPNMAFGTTERGEDDGSIPENESRAFDGLPLSFPTVFKLLASYLQIDSTLRSSDSIEHAHLKLREIA
jgi:hypothetical protein